MMLLPTGSLLDGRINLRVHIHVVRDSYGNGGQTPQQVKNALRHLDVGFNPHGIYFIWDCKINYHDDDDDFLTLGTYTDLPIIPEGINIYLFPQHPEPNAAGFGQANVIDSDVSFHAIQLYVAGNFDLPPSFQNLTTSHTIVSIRPTTPQKKNRSRQLASEFRKSV